MMSYPAEVAIAYGKEWLRTAMLPSIPAVLLGFAATCAFDAAQRRHAIEAFCNGWNASGAETLDPNALIASAGGDLMMAWEWRGAALASALIFWLILRRVSAGRAVDGFDQAVVATWIAVIAWLVASAGRPGTMTMVAGFLLAAIGVILFGFARSARAHLGPMCRGAIGGTGFSLSDPLTRARLESVGVLALSALAYVAVFAMGHAGTRLDEPALEVVADSSGQFRFSAEANSAHFQFLADTGATELVFRREDLPRLGLDPARIVFDHRFQTANGVVRGAVVELSRLVVGSCELRNVRAAIDTGELDEPLMGMSVLTRMGSVSISHGTLTLRCAQED